MLMVMCMREIGKMIRLMDLVVISILTAQNMKVIGKKINSMDTEKKHGQMELAMKEIIKTAKRMEKASLCGLMVQPMRDSS